MKKIIFPIFLVSAVLIVSAVNVTGKNLIVVQSSDVVEQSHGTIVELNANGGKVLDGITEEIRDFERPGANVVLEIGDEVIYIAIKKPNGHIIIRDIHKR